jgi:hypothetical protein
MKKILSFAFNHLKLKIEFNKLKNNIETGISEPGLSEK